MKTTAQTEAAAPLMTVEEARAHLERLNWTQGDFARFFEAGDRTARRWLSLADPLPIPRGVAFALSELTTEKLRKYAPELVRQGKPGVDNAIRVAATANMTAERGIVRMALIARDNRENFIEFTPAKARDWAKSIGKFADQAEGS